MSVGTRRRRDFTTLRKISPWVVRGVDSFVLGVSCPLVDEFLHGMKADRCLRSGGGPGVRGVTEKSRSWLDLDRVVFDTVAKGWYTETSDTGVSDVGRISCTGFRPSAGELLSYLTPRLETEVAEARDMRRPRGHVRLRQSVVSCEVSSRSGVPREAWVQSLQD